ncbi:MAG: GNAT family N-acetyltransferase [Betaproteobacteria bacterium]|nr:GNAT family N-acetyltransferase [Betaproteobacteria bacterium]
MSKGEHTRALILDQAVWLASSVGIEGLSIGSLALQLGLSKSGLFAHFGSRQALQLATLKRAQELFHARVFRPALAAQRGLPRLRALFQNWFDWLEDSRRPGGCVILAATYEFDNQPGPIHDLLAATQRELRGGIAKGVRMAIEAGHFSATTDPWQVTFELFGIILAAHHDRHMLQDLRAAERAKKAFERLVSTCLSKPAPGIVAAAATPANVPDDRSVLPEAETPRFSPGYPAELTSSTSLGLGHSITIRPIRPEDLDLETEFARNLSHESRYNRFLGGGVALTPEWLKRLTCIDFSRDMALIATVAFGGSENQIGVARYALLEDGTTCEFAIAVADQWHGYGIGEMLMRHLIVAARKAGIATMIGDIFATNMAMQGLARKLGFVVGTHPEGAELKRATLELTAGKVHVEHRDAALLA